MRCFIGIEISSDLKDKIVEIQKKFSNFDIKLVEKDNLHINLLFLGEVDGKVPQIKEIMDKIALNKFKVSIRNIGVFPSLDRINVVWLGVHDTDILNILHDGLNGELKQLGFGEERKFSPHITLGRVKSIEDKDKLVSRINEPVDLGEMEISSIILFKSILTPSGPIYEKLYIKELI